MTRNNEVDFLILGENQNVVKVNEFRIIVACKHAENTEEACGNMIYKCELSGNLLASLCRPLSPTAQLISTFDAIDEFILNQSLLNDVQFK